MSTDISETPSPPVLTQQSVADTDTSHTQTASGLPIDRETTEIPETKVEMETVRAASVSETEIVSKDIQMPATFTTGSHAGSFPSAVVSPFLSYDVRQKYRHAWNTCMLASDIHCTEMSN